MKITEPSQPSASDKRFKSLREEFLDTYQIRYVTSKAPRLVVEKSRRVGVSFAEAWRSIERRISGKSRIDAYYMSDKEDKAKKWLNEDCKLIARAFNVALRQDFGEDYIPLDLWSSVEGRFRNGSVLRILSSNPDNFRSYGGDATIDEFAFHERQEELLRAATSVPLCSPNAQLRLISTHNGAGTLFNVLCREIDSEVGYGGNAWKKMRLDIYTAVREGFAERVWAHRKKEFASRADLRKAFIEERRMECMNEEHFQQEYECIPVGSSSMLDVKKYQDMIWYDDSGKPVTIPDTLPFSQRFYGDLFVGVDCGRKVDLTVAWVVERGWNPEAPPHMAAVYRPVCIKAMSGTEFQTQYNILEPILTHPQIVAGFIDQGTVGAWLAEEVAKLTGKRIQPIALNTSNMGEMAERVKGHVEQSRVWLPGDPFIRSDLQCVSRQNRGNRWVYSGTTGKTHGDYFWAFALALHAATVFAHSFSVVNISESDTSTEEEDGQLD